MPKIAPRPEITTHPLYQATMAAQHAAYQLMREVPADRKAEAARLHGVCVHATTFATYALDPGEDQAAAWQGLAQAVSDARVRLPPLLDVAADQQYGEILTERLAELQTSVDEALGGKGAAA